MMSAIFVPSTSLRLISADLLSKLDMEVLVLFLRIKFRVVLVRNFPRPARRGFDYFR